MSKIILQLRRGGTLLGSWALDHAPLEMTLRDAHTGESIASFTAQVPNPTDEETLIQTPQTQAPQTQAPQTQAPQTQAPQRMLSDDFTMPLPELTQSPLGRLSRNPTSRNPTSRNPTSRGAAQRSRKNVMSPPPRADGDDFTMPLPDLTDEHALASFEEFDTVTDSHPPTRKGTDTGSGAEIWKRTRQAWELAGRLPPGHQLTEFGSTIALRRDGILVVTPGGQTMGSATLPDGAVISIQAGGDVLHLPPGVSITLRHGEDRLYIRSASAPG